MRHSGPFIILVVVLILAICQCSSHSTPPREDERSLDTVDSTGQADTTSTSDSSASTDTTESEEPIDTSDTVDPPDTTGSTEPTDSTDTTEPTDTTISAVRIEGYLMPLADGNYWIYTGPCNGSDVYESVSVSIIPTDSCEVAYSLKSSIGNPEFSAIVTLCNGQIIVDGRPWQPHHPTEYVSRTVPAGTFDSCYEVSSTFWFNGVDGKTYAKGIGMIERSQIWYSVRSGDSFYCRSMLSRYRIKK